MHLRLMTAYALWFGDEEIKVPFPFCACRPRADLLTSERGADHAVLVEGI